MTPTPDIAEVTAFAVEAFESAAAECPTIDVFAFAPMPSYPHVGEVMTELIRVDMELRSKRSRPLRTEYYLKRCPLLTTNTWWINSIAFEEYRLRRLSGEMVNAEDFAQRFHIDVSIWPPILPDPVRFR